MKGKNKQKKIIKHIDRCLDALGKAMIIAVSLLLLAQFLLIIIYGLKPLYAKAQSTNGTTNDSSWSGLGKINNNPTIPNLSMPVNGFNSSSMAGSAPETWIGAYIKAWYDYIVGALGIVAVVMAMWGGIKWITSGGNSGQISDAKGKIKNAVLGIVLLLLSYTIFQTINPNLLNLRLPTIAPVEEPPEVCCQNIANPKLLTKKYANCEAGETKVEIDVCNNASFAKSQDEKMKQCPEGTTGTISFLSNDITSFGNQTAQMCGGNDKVDLTKTSKSLIRSNNEFFGCYTCKIDVQMNNFTPEQLQYFKDHPEAANTAPRE